MIRGRRAPCGCTALPPPAPRPAVRCAAALAARGAPAAERAHHVERSARHGDTAAVEVLREAARAAGQRAPLSAAGLYGAALRVLPETAPATERVGLLSALADAHSSAGQFDQAHAAVVDALDLLPAGDSASRLRLTASCAVLESILGRHHQAHTRLRDTLDGLSDTGSPEAVELMLVLGLDAFYRRDYASMRDWTDRALIAAKPLGNRSLTATAASTSSWRASSPGTWRRLGRSATRRRNWSPR